MIKQPWVGLVCAGPVSRSGLTRIPRLHEQLGWVKSNTITTASRAVNVLRAGQAVRDYESLSKAELIVVQAPEEGVAPILEELACSGVYWPGRTVALSHAVLDSSRLELLERRGASVASFTIVGEEPVRFLVEGQPAAVQRLRRFFKNAHTSIIEIHHGRKNDYLAGVYAATAEFLPLLASAVDRFERAGMQKAAAGSTAASLIDSTMRAYFRAGKRLLDRPHPKTARPES